MKRGGGLRRVDLADHATSDPDDELLALDLALNRLMIEDPVAARVVELRQFAGLGTRTSRLPSGSPSTSPARNGLMPVPGSVMPSRTEDFLRNFDSFGHR